MALIFDSHAHYDDERFREDRDAVLSSLPQKGVGAVLNAACDLESCASGFALSQRYPFVYAAAGVHPQDAGRFQASSLDAVASYLEKPKVVALGEIGLDYHYDSPSRPVQLAAFEAQLSLAKDCQKPVVVHDRDAHGDTLELLKKYRPKGIVHCFSGSAELARELIKLGFYIGFTGVVTFKNAKKPLEAAAAVPLDRLLIETDCPYMAPEPYRGKRCDSSMLPRVLEALAAVKGATAEELAERTWRNACAVYGLDL